MLDGGVLEAGDRVEVDDGRGNWLPGVVKGSNPDGSVDVHYDDGTSERQVPLQYIRVEPVVDYALSGTHLTAQEEELEGSSDMVPSGSRPEQPVEACAPLDQTCLPQWYQKPPKQAPLLQRPVSRGQIAAGGTTWGQGSRVNADYASLGFYHPATVTAVHSDGTYDLVYDDGLTEQYIPSSRIMRPNASRPASRPNSRPRSASSRCGSPVACENPAQPRKMAMNPPPRPTGPPPSRVEDFFVGCSAEGNWKGLGYWHPCVVIDMLPSRGFILRYEDGFEEEASAGQVRPAGSRGTGAFGSQPETEDPRHSAPPPRRGNRRASSRPKQPEIARKESNLEKARIEVIKAKPEDKKWADAHGFGGERGLFRAMIARYRAQQDGMSAAFRTPSLSEVPISVFVRSRPMLSHEVKSGDFDVVTPGSSNVSGVLVMHEPKVMVDLSKAMNNHSYTFDGVFGETSTNQQIFETALQPMVCHLLETNGGHGTCFAYGQTGSGKTVTMSGLGDASLSSGNEIGLYGFVAGEIFSHVSRAAERGIDLAVRCAFLEIYRGKCYDLLGRKRPIEVREDEHGQQNLVGLQQVDVSSAEQLLQLLARSERATRATAQNETSSRSHAILQITVLLSGPQSWQEGSLRCKLSLVDLAGSEWAAKAQSDDRSNRLDGAEINKSLLCLKECIRALGAKGAHIPFRGSKLTQVLKDSFVGKESRTVMIANIAPSSASCEHSLNTLRYAQRVKDWQAQQGPQAAPPRLPPTPTHSSMPSQTSPKMRGRQQSASASPEEPRLPPPQHRDAEVDDLARTLNWSREQVHADQAAARLLEAEEALLSAHAAAVAHEQRILPEAEALLELGRQERNMEHFAVQLRALQKQKQQLMDSVSVALNLYEQCCAQEDEARLRVKGMNLPWE